MSIVPAACISEKDSMRSLRGPEADDLHNRSHVAKDAAEKHSQ